jgi:hemerythrin-like domain-containing protein
MVETVQPNVGADMLRIHRVITRALDVSAERGAAFAQEGFPSAALQEGFLTYLRALAGVLNAHHLGEDETAFPYMREKLPDAPYNKLMADHRQIEGVLEHLGTAAGAVAGNAQPADALRTLNGIVVRLAGLWHPHIGIEESILFDPEVVAALMDEEENVQLSQKMGESSQKHLHAPDVEIPFVLYNLGPEDRAIMVKMLPPVVAQQLVPLVWRAKWAPMKPFLLE